MADVEAMGRLISLSLRSGIPIMQVHRQLRGIASDRPIGLGPNKVLSVPDAIGIAIEMWYREKQGVQQELLDDEPDSPAASVVSAAPVREQVTTAGAGAEVQMSLDSLGNGAAFMGTCPDCGSQLEYAEGCVKCHVCGFSECG
jgi:ribonucleoside-diphosphate reductase alpha chain